jgi:TP901 family phage tail tape measure protein
MVALASAFVRLRPDPNKGEFTATGKEMGDKAGAAAGKAFGDGFYRDANGKLRQANGRFATDAQKRMLEGGTAAGGSFADGFGKGSSRIMDSLKNNLKMAAGVFVPLGLGAAVAEIGQIGMAYEDNLNIFKSVSKATAAEMSTVADKARQLGADVQLPGVSAAGAAAAMTELAKAGFSVQDSMDAARATLQLARIANISEAEAAEIAANAVNAFGIEAKDTGKVVDQLAAAANSSSIEVTEASHSFKQAAAAFSGLLGPAVGSEEAITELNTAIAVLGNNGIKGSDAGTSLKQMLLQLTGPSDKASGLMKLLALNAAEANVPLKDQAAIMNGTAKEQREAWGQLSKLNPEMDKVGNIAYDASGKMRSLRDILDQVAKGTAGMTQEEKNFVITQIFGADATRSVLALLKGGLPVYDQMREAIVKQGAAADFAAAKNAGLRGAIDNVKSQLENAAISVYNVVKGPLTTALNGIADALPGIFDKIGAFAGFIQDNIGVIRDWAVAIGAVTLAIKINSAMLAVQAAGGLIQFVKGVSIVTRATQAWAAAQTLLNASLFANPIGLIIIAITALIGGLVLLYRHNETFRKIVQAVWGAIKTAISATVDWIVHTAWPAIKAAWDAVAAAAMWLWRNAILPAWNGIKAAVEVVVAIVRGYITALVAVFRFLAGIAMWLWQNIFGPVFAGIRKIIEIWWLAVQVIFKFVANIIVNQVGKAISWLRDVWDAVFTFVRLVVQRWWADMQRLFGLFRTYVLGPLATALETVRAFFARIFSAIAGTISTWWRNNVSPVLAAVRGAWERLAGAFSSVYNNNIKPVFQRFTDFIKNVVVKGFQTGVDLIGKAWDKVKEVAKKPVEFVVNRVINPFIRGLNTAAAVVGVKDRVSEIPGFRDGGQVGLRSGGKISGGGSFTDNRQAWIPGFGAVQLRGGEFVVNPEMTAKALPLLRWVNAGMQGGAAMLTRMLGKTPAREPGDGSEGWAFRDGGLIGFAKDVWGAITNPVETMKKPFDALINKIPGGGKIRDFLIGAGKRLLNGAVSWLTGIGNGEGGGNVGKAMAFVRSQAGKPYIWADAGPDGYDCSGIVSAVYNMMAGKRPYSHTFSTGSLPGPWFRPGKTGPLMAGWSHPGQRPASASVGHMAGQIGALPFESTGSRGVVIGPRARRITEFANKGAARFRDGGLFDQPIRLFDSGGYWPSGTLGANLSGRTEYVDPNGRTAGTRNYYITNNIAPGGHPAEVGRATVAAIQAFEASNGSDWRRRP